MYANLKVSQYVIASDLHYSLVCCHQHRLAHGNVGMSHIHICLGIAALLNFLKALLILIKHLFNIVNPLLDKTLFYVHNMCLSMSTQRTNVIYLYLKVIWQSTIFQRKQFTHYITNKRIWTAQESIFSLCLLPLLQNGMYCEDKTHGLRKQHSHLQHSGTLGVVQHKGTNNTVCCNKSGRPSARDFLSGICGSVKSDKFLQNKRE